MHCGVLQKLYSKICVGVYQREIFYFLSFIWIKSFIAEKRKCIIQNRESVKTTFKMICWYLVFDLLIMPLKRDFQSGMKNKIFMGWINGGQKSQKQEKNFHFLRVPPVVEVERGVVSKSDTTDIYYIPLFLRGRTQTSTYKLKGTEKP